MMEPIFEKPILEHEMIILGPSDLKRLVGGEITDTTGIDITRTLGGG